MFPGSSHDGKARMPLKVYLHVRFQGAISPLANSFQRIEIIGLFSKPASLMQNWT